MTEPSVISWIPEEPHYTTGLPRAAIRRADLRLSDRGPFEPKKASLRSEKGSGSYGRACRTGDIRTRLRVSLVTTPPPHEKRRRGSARLRLGGRRALDGLLQTVIYEMHVSASPNTEFGCRPAGRGHTRLTRNPYSRISALPRGALPVFQFDAQTVPRAGQYWGTARLLLRAPLRLQLAEGSLGPGRLPDMVKALHRAGIEVILDVFNHTAEGNHEGRRSASRVSRTRLLHPGADRSATPTIPARKHPERQPTIVRRLILDSCIRVEEMHVDVSLRSRLNPFSDESGRPGESAGTLESNQTRCSPAPAHR